MCKFKKIYIGFIPAAKLLSDLSQFILLWIFINGTTAPSSVQYMLLSFKKNIFLCFRISSWNSSIQSERLLSAQDSQSESSDKRSNLLEHTHIWRSVLNERLFSVRVELPAADQRDLCVLSEDGVSPGETGGQSEHLPQLLFPLLSLQLQTQVSG